MENRNSKNVNVAEKSPFTSKNTIKVVCKFATMVAIAILVAMITNNALLADPPDPPPDCPGTPFRGPVTTTIIIDGCEFTYTYWWRYACNVYYDSYVESVKLTKGGPECEKIFVEQYSKIIDSITTNITVVQRPWEIFRPPLDVPYPPPYIIPHCNDGMSPTQWRFFSPSCLTKDPILYWNCETDEMVMERMKCTSKGYCYKTYRFCWKEDGNGNLVLQKTQSGGGAFGSIGCEPIIVNGGGIRLECVPTCDE